MEASSNYHYFGDFLQCNIKFGYFLYGCDIYMVKKDGEVLLLLIILMTELYGRYILQINSEYVAKKDAMLFIHLWPGYEIALRSSALKCPYL